MTSGFKGVTTFKNKVIPWLKMRKTKYLKKVIWYTYSPIFSQKKTPQNFQKPNHTSTAEANQKKLEK